MPQPMLPPGWSWVIIKDVIAKYSTTGLKLKQKDYLAKGKYPVVDQGQFLIGGYSNDASLLVICDLPVIVFGDHTKIKKYIDFHFIAGADGIKIIKPHEIFETKLFYYFLHCIEYADKGYARHFQYVEKSIIPLPPLPEQQRIVAKIEELFSELDDGVASFKKAKEQIRNYRQSILNAAFSGKLIPGKYADDWEWVKLGEVIESLQYGTSDKATMNDEGVPVLRMGNIQDGKLDYSNLKYFPKEHADIKKYCLTDGDILFNRTNSAELVGKSAIYKEYFPKSIFASYLIRIRTKPEVYSSTLLNYFINSQYGRSFIKSVVSQNVGQANVNGTKLQSMPVPLIPFKQQLVIVSEIERRFSEADNLEKAMTEGLAKAETLKQSILKQAFEGRLL